jgi:hypothetical protein
MHTCLPAAPAFKSPPLCPTSVTLTPPPSHPITPSLTPSPRDVDLPSDAFTDDITAKVEGGQLTITIARRDPEGPAMQVGGLQPLYTTALQSLPD